MKKILLVLWLIAGIMDIVSGPTLLEFVCVWITLLLELIEDINE